MEHGRSGESSPVPEELFVGTAIRSAFAELHWLRDDVRLASRVPLARDAIRLQAETADCNLESLGAAIDLEHWAPMVGLPAMPVRTDRIYWGVRFHDAMVGYHATLPYDEPELHWLVCSYERVDAATSFATGTFVETLFDLQGDPSTAEVVNRGVPQTATFSELIDRWQDWCNGTGAFERESRHRGRTALKTVYRLLAERLPTEEGWLESEPR